MVVLQIINLSRNAKLFFCNSLTQPNYTNLFKFSLQCHHHFCRWPVFWETCSYRLKVYKNAKLYSNHCADLSINIFKHKCTHKKKRSTTNSIWSWLRDLQTLRGPHLLGRLLCLHGLLCFIKNAGYAIFCGTVFFIWVGHKWLWSWI